MTPRPPTHREPTDAEMQCLPEGTLFLNQDKIWRKSQCAGMMAAFFKKDYAVPITQEEVKQEKCQFTRGMICAAALVAKSEGRESTFAREMLRYAGGENAARLHGDVEDLETLGITVTLPVRPNAAACGQCADKVPRGMIPNECPGCGQPV